MVAPVNTRDGTVQTMADISGRRKVNIVVFQLVWLERGHMCATEEAEFYVPSSNYQLVQYPLLSGPQHPQL